MARTINTTLKLKDQFSKVAKKIVESTKKIKTATEKLRAQMTLLQNKMRYTATKIIGNFKRMAKELGKKILIGIGASIAYVGVKGTKLANDLVETNNLLVNTFGKSKGSIDIWSKSLVDNFNLSEVKAKGFASRFGAIMNVKGLSKDALAGMSEGLTELTADFASAYNRTNDDVFEKLRSGMTGESEGLKDLGIIMNQADLKRFAKETMGITTSLENMSTAEKMVLRYDFIRSMAKDKEVIGDVERSTGTLAYNIKSVQAKFENISVSLMSGFIPVLENITTWVSDNMDGIQKWADSFDTQKFIDGVVEVAEAIKRIGKAVLNLTPLLATLYFGSKATGIISFLKDSPKVIEALKGVRIALVKLVPALKLSGEFVGLLKESFSTLGRGLSMGIVDKRVFSTIATSFKGLGGTILVAFKSIGLGIKAIFMSNPIGIILGIIAGLVTLYITCKPFRDFVNNMAKSIGKFFVFVGKGFRDVFNNMGESIMAIPNAIQGMIDRVKNTFPAFGEFVQMQFDGLKLMFGGVIDFITGVFTGDWEKALGGLRDIFVGMFKFMASQALFPIQAIINGINSVSKRINAIGGENHGVHIAMIPDLPKFATGGLTNGISIAGEGKDDEFIIPKNNSKRSQDILNIANRSIGKDNSKQGVTVIVQGDIYGYDDFKNKIAQGIDDIFTKKMPNLA